MVTIPIHQSWSSPGDIDYWQSSASSRNKSLLILYPSTSRILISIPFRFKNLIVNYAENIVYIHESIELEKLLAKGIQLKYALNLAIRHSKPGSWK